MSAYYPLFRKRTPPPPGKMVKKEVEVGEEVAVLGSAAASCVERLSFRSSSLTYQNRRQCSVLFPPSVEEMQLIDSSETLLSLVGERGFPINSSTESQLYWKRQVAIISCDVDDPERITSIRVRGQKINEVDAKGVISKLKGLVTTAIDPSDGNRLYVAPTRHDLSKMTISGCKRKFQHTVIEEGKLRVAVVYSEDDGIDGVDLGVYKAVGYTAGNGNFLVLERCENEDPASIPKPQSVGSPVLFDQSVFRSNQEGRVAVLLKALGIPYLDENSLEQVSDVDGHKYSIDFMIYPDDPSRAAYLEVKPFRPIREEIMKAVAVFRATNVPVFLVWGKYFVQGIGMWNDKHGVCNEKNRFNDIRKYEEGIRAIKISRVDGKVACDEGYYFMTNNSAVGAIWVETTEMDDNPGPLPFDHQKLAELLDKGKRKFNREKRDKFRMTGRIRKSTRVRSSSTGKIYKPNDGFKAYLFKDVMEPCTDASQPGMSDCFSPETRAAFKQAEEFTFV